MYETLSALISLRKEMMSSVRKVLNGNITRISEWKGDKDESRILIKGVELCLYHNLS